MGLFNSILEKLGLVVPPRKLRLRFQRRLHHRLDPWLLPSPWRP